MDYSNDPQEFWNSCWNVLVPVASIRPWSNWLGFFLRLFSKDDRIRIPHFSWCLARCCGQSVYDCWRTKRMWTATRGFVHLLVPLRDERENLLNWVQAVTDGGTLIQLWLGRELRLTMGHTDWRRWCGLGPFHRWIRWWPTSPSFDHPLGLRADRQCTIRDWDLQRMNKPREENVFLSAKSKGTGARCSLR